MCPYSMGLVVFTAVIMKRYIPEYGTLLLADVRVEKNK
jgi:hypothetical protein